MVARRLGAPIPGDGGARTGGREDSKPWAWRRIPLLLRFQHNTGRASCTAIVGILRPGKAPQCHRVRASSVKTHACSGFTKLLRRDQLVTLLCILG